MPSALNDSVLATDGRSTQIQNLRQFDKLVALFKYPLALLRGP
jgi:hypothetical protein